MRKFYSFVVKYRIAIFVLFVVAAIAGALLRPLVGVNYDIKDYLPEESPSTRGLVVMSKEFGGSMPNCRVMINGITYEEGLRYKAKLEQVDGVEQVSWLDDSLFLDGAPMSFAGDQKASEFFRKDEGKNTGSTIMTLTINKDKNLSAVSEVRKIVGDKNNMTGDAVSTAVATKQTVTEIAKVAAASVLFVLIILILTTMSWLDPVIILAGIGVAVLINNGTNLIFGEISFVTNASGSILQLAVSLDYSVFLIHRFEECRRERLVSAANQASGITADGIKSGVSDKEAAESAMIDALVKCTGSIASSGLTTVIGFLALILMRFQIGPDMGLALAKGVAISLITVFMFTPAVILIMRPLTDSTRHKKLLPDFTGLGKFVRKCMIPAVIVFAIILVPSFILSNSNSYYYGASHIFGPGTQVGDDTEKIEQAFGTSDTYAVMVPKNDKARERKLTAELKGYKEITNIRSYSEILGNSIPSDLLPKSISGLLISENYTRIVLTVDAKAEGDETFDLVRRLRETCSSIYGDEYYLVGGGVSTYDLMDTVTQDLLRINLVAVLAIYIILVLMFRKLFLPALLVASIEAAIWINVAIPELMGQSVFYIAYLIISSVQLGATVDYAILFTDRYRENRESFGRRDAVVETVKNVVASVITSGGAMIVVGFLMGILSSHGILAQLGIFIGRGAIFSLIIVLFVLPGLLYLFDRFVLPKGHVEPQAA